MSEIVPQKSSNFRRIAVMAGVVALAGTIATVPMSAQADLVRDAQYWLDDYGIRDAWNTTIGEGVTVAVIDTGIASGPQEFAGAIAGGHDSSGLGSSDGRSPVGDGEAGAHGSWVASLLSGRGTTADGGVLGVAPGAKLLSISVGFTGSGATVPFTDQIVDAVRWAVDNGASVINMSLTTNEKTWPENWDEAFTYAFDNDVVVVAAAGNRETGTAVVGAPATIPGILTVAGVDRNGAASWQSSSQGTTIGVSAPSEDLVGVSPDGTHVYWKGTSGAAPIVAGVVALIRAAHPDMDAHNVINNVIDSATPAPAQTEQPSPIYGFGLVNAAAAVAGSAPTVTENPMGNLYDWIDTYRPGATQNDPSSDAETDVDATRQPVDLLRAETSESTDVLAAAHTMIYLVIPLAVIVGTAILALVGVIAAIRYFRRVAHNE